MHIIRYLTYHKKSIPDCIKKQLKEDCGTEKLVSAYDRLIKLNKSDKSTNVQDAQKLIQESLATGNSQDISTELAIVKNDHEEKISLKNLTLSDIRTTLDSIDCPDSLRHIWKEVLLAYVDKLQGVESKQRQSQLSSYAQLCSYEYGDAVHWARSLLSEEEHIDFEQYDNCRSELIGYRNIPKSAIKSIDKPLLYPSPNDGHITVELPNYYQSTNMEIYNIQGQLIWNRMNISEPSISIDLSLENGTYMIKITPEEGASTIQKFTVIK